MVMRLRRLLMALSVVGVLLPISAIWAQNQMPDQGGGARLSPGTGLIQKGQTLSLSVPVAAINGGAGTVNGILKANGSGAVTAAVTGNDYALPPSGTSILKANGAGGFSSAV